MKRTSAILTALFLCILCSGVMSAEHLPGEPVPSVCAVGDTPVSREDAVRIATENGAYFEWGSDEPFSNSTELVATETGCVWQLHSCEIIKDKRGWVHYYEHTALVNAQSGKVIETKRKRDRFFVLKRY